MDNYGLALKILRKRFSLTQTELAEKIGVSNHAVSKWENGINQPDVTTLQSICKLFDLTVDQFLRLASGESEESVFSTDKGVENLVEKKPDNKSKRIVVFIAIITACLIALIAGIISASCGKDKVDGEESTYYGTQESYLSDINNAIILKNGVNEYDYVGTLKHNDKTNTIGAYKIVIDKRNGEYKKFYVKNSSDNLDVYGDNNYFYVTTEYGENLRLNKNAYDLSEYFEDIEELYSLEDITTITARKNGNVYIYEFGLTDECVKSELEDFYEEFSGVIITECKATFTIGTDSSNETVRIKFIYQGVEYEFTASRQLKSNSTFKFPDFSTYKEGVNVGETLRDISDVLSSTKNLENTKRVCLKTQAKAFQFLKQI